MKATNTLATASKKPTFSAVINSQSMQNMIGKTLNDTRRAASFTATLISAVSASPQLAACKPESIISAALSGEAMDLSLRLGQYSIVPYGDTANYQISYKGLCQLAIRSGLYKRLKVQDVREGEYLGEDPDTWEPIVKRITSGREQLPLAGIRAFYELENGFRNALYWEHEKILDHADRYSQAFSKEKYDKMRNGEMSPDEVKKLQKGSPWYGDPLSEAHLKMCRKTVIIQLLNDGVAPLSIEMRMALDHEETQERNGPLIFEDDPAVVEANAHIANAQEQSDVVDSTATVVDVKQQEPKQEPPKQEPVQKPAGRARTASAPRKDLSGSPDVQKVQNSLRQAEKQAKEEPPVPMQGDLSDYMNPPTDLSGLPFADV